METLNIFLTSSMYRFTKSKKDDYLTYMNTTSTYLKCNSQSSVTLGWLKTFSYFRTSILFYTISLWHHWRCDWSIFHFGLVEYRLSLELLVMGNVAPPCKHKHLQYNFSNVTESDIIEPSNFNKCQVKRWLCTIVSGWRR